MDALYQSEIRSLPLLHRGKVRDIYEVDEERMLIVTTDRISAFDVVLPDPIPGKGMVLDAISRFWFERTRELVANHLLDVPLEEILPDPSERVGLDGRSTVARRLDPQPVEAVVRGYLIGSGWKDYQRTGGVCGIDLPDGLLLADQLPEPIYTPATKAELGEHDENISFGETVSMLGEDKAVAIRDAALEIYAYASAYALARGIIIADTKFEFGLDADGELVLMDEVLTPDSSRFWPREDYQPGNSPLSFDKQFVRDYLETLDWDKTDPGPELPAEIVEKTAEKYREVYRILTGRDLAP